MASEAGKGSKPRPFSVTQEEYDQRWDLIFAKNKNSNEKNDENTSQVDSKRTEV